MCVAIDVRGDMLPHVSQSTLILDHVISSENQAAPPTCGSSATTVACAWFPLRSFTTLSDAGGAARAIRQCTVVQIPDVLADPQYKIQETALTVGFRAILAVHKLRPTPAGQSSTLPMSGMWKRSHG